MAVSSLLQPFRCKSLTLANRIVMAPMTRYFSPGGVPTSEVADYYRRRAKGDVGLLITEGVATDRPASRNNENVPTLYGDAALAGWRHVVGEVHGAGGRIAPQLWHTGPVPDSIGIYPLSPEVESPSAYYSEDVRPGRAMSDKDIEEVAASFARAAMTAKRLGFDCIEFHGAHSYIFDLFFWPKTNFRTDRYGGPDFANRTRFAVEVIEAVRAAVGEDFVLIFRFSQWKQQDYGARVAETPAELEAWLTPLADAGIDIFDCSQRRFWEPEFAGSDLNLAGWAKKVTGKATMTVGSVGLTDEFLGSLAEDGAIGVTGLASVAERLDRGEFDLVGVGRALLTDPDWLVKIRDDRIGELIPFQRAQIETLY